MALRWTRELIWIFAAGAVIRAVLLILTPGLGYDMQSLTLVGDILREDPLHLYGLNPETGTGVWPYSTGYGPLAALMTGLSDLFGVEPNHLVRLPQAIADLAIAWIVCGALQRAGASAKVVVITAAGLALGPVPLIASTVHGQIDSVAFLPAIAAAILWVRDPERFALGAGLLLGLAISIKHPAGIVLLGLLVTCTSWRSAIRLVVPAAVVPLVLTIPFALAEPDGFKRVINYAGISGYGGLELIFNRDLAISRVVPEGFPSLDGAAAIVHDNASLITGAAVLASAGVLRWLRVGAYSACAVLLLVAMASLATFGPWYGVWPLAFLFLAGWWRAALAFQALLLVPMLILYRDLLLQVLPGDPTIAVSAAWATNVYAPLMILVAIACATIAALIALRAARAPAAP